MIEVPPSTEYLVLDAKGEPLARSPCVAEGLRMGRRRPDAVCVVGAPTGVLIAHILRGPLESTKGGSRAQAAWRAKNPFVKVAALPPPPPAPLETPKTDESRAASAFSLRPPNPRTALILPLASFAKRRKPVSLEEGRTFVIYTVSDQGSDAPQTPASWTRVGTGAVRHDGSLDLVLEAIPLSGVLRIQGDELKERAAMLPDPLPEPALPEPTPQPLVETTPSAPPPPVTLGGASAPPKPSLRSGAPAEAFPPKTKNDRRNERRRNKRRLEREAREAAILAAGPPPPLSADEESKLPPEERRRRKKNAYRKEKRRLAREAKAREALNGSAPPVVVSPPA